MDKLKDVSVLVVGAGPTGLTMAAELARRGIPCRLIEKVARASEKSKALVIQPRTLEVFQDMGIADEAVASGHPLPSVTPYLDGKPLGKITFQALESPFPFPLILDQSENERILGKLVQKLGIQIERQKELLHLEQNEDHVKITTKNSDGTEEEFLVNWVIGCDGAHSTVRHLLGLPFEGSAYNEEFILADVQLDWELARNEGFGFVLKEGLIAAIPKGNGRYRLIINQRELRPKSTDDVTLHEIQSFADRFIPVKTLVHDPIWLARFQTHRRIVPRFRQNRVFLAGDAAHIHSPAGGQGMNTGIQDAYNLAWKLALVISMRGKGELLDTYHLERHPVAKFVLKGTDRAFRIISMRSNWIRFLQRCFAPYLLKQVWFQKKITTYISELEIGYPQSPIVKENWNDRGGIRPGCRAPDALLFRDGKSIQLFEILRGTNHVLLFFCNIHNPEESLKLYSELQTALRIFRDVISAHLISKKTFTISNPISAFTDENMNLYRKHGTEVECLYLIRPDGYVAYRSKPVNVVFLMEYLSKIFVSK
jgi:2-polyprenyl-6-methoxyphenol hydroxylase-like FAD-dependent oxidoreductase